MGASDLDRRDAAMLATLYMLALRRSELAPGLPSLNQFPAVLCPLLDVCVHVIETPRVRLKAVDRHRALAILTLGAAALVRLETTVVVGLLPRDRRFPPEWCLLRCVKLAHGRLH
jgi:hypothetical protein